MHVKKEEVKVIGCHGEGNLSLREAEGKVEHREKAFQYRTENRRRKGVTRRF